MQNSIKGLPNGTVIDFANPSKHKYTPQEISQLLFHVKRFNGLGVSVAKHCVDVAYTMFNLTGSAKMALIGLLHDSQEAYTGDFSSPLKSVLGETIELVESRVHNAIVEQLCPSVANRKEFTPFLKVIDLIALRTEYDRLVRDEIYSHNEVWDILLQTYPNVKTLGLSKPFRNDNAFIWLDDFDTLIDALPKTPPCEVISVETKWGTLTAEVLPSYKETFMKLGEIK